MPKLRPVDWKTLKAVFEADGFTYARIKGSHYMMTKPGVLRPIVIPMYSEVQVDIIKSCMRTAGMNRERYFKLLSS